MSSFWSACQLQPQRDHLALHFLAQAGFETYAPRVRSERLLRGRAVEARPQLLFGTYIFVLVQLQWWTIGRTPGVVRIVCDGGRPARVPDQVIDELRRREGPDGLIRLPRRPPPRGLHRGDKVHVVAGPFEGLSGLYEGMSARDRVRVLLTLLNAPRVVELPGGDVERAQRSRRT